MNGVIYNVRVGRRAPLVSRGAARRDRPVALAPRCGIDVTRSLGHAAQATIAWSL